MKANRPSSRDRRGAVLVLFVLSLVAMFAFLALAIDLGMVAMARTQCQDAADSAAMAGTRALNGNTTNGANNNYSAVAGIVQTMATGNTVLGKAITTGQVTYQIGRYTYVAANQRFEGQFPGPSGENWSMVQATISTDASSQMMFSKLFNLGARNIQATATAIHRPRDLAIILDYSGSMRYASQLGVPAWGDRATNNPDTNVPAFGHYSGNGSLLTATNFTSPYDEANYTTTTSDGRLPLCADFYTDTAGTAAFTKASSAYATAPGGSNYLKTSKNTGSSYCTTVKDLLAIGTVTGSTRDATFETSGYKAYSMSTINHSYTQGPGYWGKTFFIWPPDPKNDWRSLYFGTTDNSKLWDSSGNWKTPGSSTYTINYTAILAWIKASPTIFPTSMQSGRIAYYTSIPSTISTSSWPPSDLNQRFWKDYIDYCLGLMQTGTNSWTILCDGNTGYTGYGSDFTSGTVKITASSSLSGSPPPYMHYQDNPKRPLNHFWFGPLSMVDFLLNTNINTIVSPDYSRYTWLPGTCHESPMYACKLGIRAAMTDIQSNHPNDYVSLIMFSTPRTSSSDPDGRFNRPRVGLGQDYSDMQESLWYPPATLGSPTATVTPYDSNNIEVPRAMGGTCYSMGLMLAFNQFSANTALTNYNAAEPAGDAGGNGRKGAQKIIIFETDGAPNTTATASFTNGGSYKSYYNVRYNSTGTGSGEYPTSVNQYNDNDSTVTTQVYSLCTRLAALDSASSPGYSTSSKPLQIHCLGFGPQFDPSNSSSGTCTATLNQMQTIGNVTDNMPGYKIIYGNQASIVSDLQTAIKLILQTGVQVSLIQ